MLGPSGQGQSCRWALLALALCCCAPAVWTPQLAGPLVLTPTEGRLAFPLAKAGTQLIGRVDLVAPGILRVDGLPAGARVWLAPDRGRRLSDANRRLLMPLAALDAADAAKAWYLFVDSPDSLAGAREAFLSYRPSWAPLEDWYDQAQVRAEEDRLDPAGLYEEAVQARAQLRGEFAPYSAWTQGLERRLELLQQQLAGRLVAEYVARAGTLAASGQFAPSESALAAAVPYLDRLSAASATLLEPQLEAVRESNARGGFIDALAVSRLEDLLRYCGQIDQSSTDLRQARREMEAVCLALGLVRAQQWLDAAEESLVQRPRRGAALADSAARHLQRQQSPLNLEDWDRVRAALTAARRSDLLSQALVLNRADLLAGQRSLSDLAAPARQALQDLERYRAGRDRAEDQALEGRYERALQEGDQALGTGGLTAERWRGIGQRRALPQLEDQLRFLENDMRLLQARMQDWQAYRRYQTKERSWAQTMERGARIEEVEGAWDARAQLDRLIDDIRYSDKPPGLPGATPEELIQRAQAIKTDLGIPIVLQNLQPAVLAQVDFDGLVALYHLADDILVLGRHLEEGSRSQIDQARGQFGQRAEAQAQGRIDAFLRGRQWSEAQAWADRAGALGKQVEKRLRTRIAVGRARHLRDQAQQDLDRAYVAEALDKYEEAERVTRSFQDDGAAREIHDFVVREIADLSDQNVSLVNLETRLLPLAKCLGKGQPLPESMPFNLIIREALIALPKTGADYYVSSCDIELVLPAADYAKVSIQPMTTDKKQVIPLEITDLLDGHISCVFRTASLLQTPHVQITFDGGGLQLREIGARWSIRKGARH